MGEKGQYIIGIDSGTSVVKASVFDLNGNEIAVSNRKTPVYEHHYGWSEFDMDIDWKETALAIKEVLDKAGIKKEEVLAVGITGKGVGVCFMDKNIRPLRLGILWNDARTVPLMEKWIADGTMDKIFEISANWLMPGDMGLLIPWIAEHEPDVIKNTYQIMLPTAWLAYKMTDVVQANQTDVYSQLDARKGVYSQKIFELEGITQYAHIFPELGKPWDILGGVTKKAAEETGLLEGTPVVRLGWDVIACTAGVGAIHDGQANIILGTSGVIEVVLPEPSFNPKRLGLQSIHSVPDKWCRLIAPMNCTPHVDWFLETMAYEDKVRAKEKGCSVFDILEEEVSKIEPGSHGVIFHPYMSATGERAPFTKTTAKANFFGMDYHSNRYVLLRALYEGIAFSNKHCLDVYPIPITDVRLSGGGSKSPVWCQIFADILNSPIRIPSGTELGAKGAAWNAAFAIGIFKTREEAVDQFCKVTRTYEPNPEAVKRYAELYEIYKMLIPQLYDAWDARANFLKKYNKE
jgi:sugar (pentulose or hexulose) kinase